jgi:hypothetical protein
VANRTDEAALLGVALAGAVAVAVAPEAWDWTDTAVGATLIAVLVGYYRPPRSSSWREVVGPALALATVAGLCGALMLTRPLLVLIHTPSKQQDTVFLCTWAVLAIIVGAGFRRHWRLRERTVQDRPTV